jgi:hypothetical protein
MLRPLSVVPVLTVLIFLSQPLQADPKDAGRTIELWTRAPGNYARGADPGREKLKQLDLDQQTLTSVKKKDVQYGETRSFKGLSLASVLASYDPPATLDMVILHFANGVLIPLPRSEAEQSPGLFIARYTRNSKKAWTSLFPPVAKEDPTFRYKDPNPVTFSGNKLVSTTQRHPDVTSKVFSPWLLAGSLTGIEFANRDAYYGQFSAKNNEGGLKVWTARCQFCHGVNKVGADFGWDFVDPVPVWKLKNAEHVYNKLKYPYHDALERGLQMPTQTDVSQAEVGSLWGWIEKLGKEGTKPYQP